MLLQAALLMHRRDQVAALKESIDYDDFSCSAQSVRRAKTVGSGAKRARAQGGFWIVTLQLEVRSRGKTVPFVVDAADNTYAVSEEGQRAFDTEHGVLPAGRIDIRGNFKGVRTFVFDLPAGVRSPRLQISFGPISDFVTNIVEGHKTIKLD